MNPTALALATGILVFTVLFACLDAQGSLAFGAAAGEGAVVWLYNRIRQSGSRG